MSGGKFDYKQYCIGDIADSIVMEIARAKRPLPPPTIRKDVYSKVKTGEGRFSYDGRYWNHFESVDEAKEYFRNNVGTEILSERTLPNGERELTVLHKRTNETMVFTSYTEEVYLDELGREIHQPEYSEETIKEFKNAIRTLRMAQVYAQRVDWLICGDDGEDSFHERLAEDLDAIDHFVNGWTEYLRHHSEMMYYALLQHFTKMKHPHRQFIAKIEHLMAVWGISYAIMDIVNEWYNRAFVMSVNRNLLSIKELMKKLYLFEIAAERQLRYGRVFVKDVPNLDQAMNNIINRFYRCTMQRQNIIASNAEEVREVIKQRIDGGSELRPGVIIGKVV